MPIEIKELKIKINISDSPDTNFSNQLPKKNSIEFREMKKEIVNECIQKVLEKIKENSQR